MKIVVLNGSPRKGGNTEIMTQAFAEAARKNQNEVSILDVAPMNIRGCLGCKYCWAHKGECVQKDDMGKVFEALVDADMVVFASPIYWFDITAQMKTVIDRLYAGGSVGFHFHKTALLLDAAAAEPHSRKAGKIWGSILRGLWPLAAALVLRKGLAALLCAANGVSGQDGTASKTIFWFQRDSVRAAVVIPVREWLTNYLARAFGIPALALLALASWAVVLWVLRHRGGNGRALFAAGLIVSQFSLGILQGTGAQMARAVQCFAVFVPFAAWLWLAPALDRGKQGGAKAIICAALAGAMLAVELISLTGTIRYNRDRWQYEERLLIKTADELNDLDPAGTLPVAFVGQAELSPELQDRLVIPAANPAYKAAYLIYTVLGGPLGDLDRYENPQTMVINWAQDAFGGKEQIALLMQQVGRPCALADADQQDAADTLAEAGEAPVGVSLQDGYLLVNFTGWTAE